MTFLVRCSSFSPPFVAQGIKIFWTPKPLKIHVNIEQTRAPKAQQLVHWVLVYLCEEIINTIIINA